MQMSMYKANYNSRLSVHAYKLIMQSKDNFATYRNG